MCYCWRIQKCRNGSCIWVAQKHPCAAPHPKCDEYISLLNHHFDLLFTETVQLARTYNRRSVEWEDTVTATCQREADEFLANNCVEVMTDLPVVIAKKTTIFNQAGTENQ
jgi:hypothetical protein